MRPGCICSIVRRDGVGKTAWVFAGQPGKMFARPFVIQDGVVPGGGFNADHELFNTRIPPQETDRFSFHFALPKDGPVTVRRD